MSVQILRLREVAKELGYPPETLRHWRKEGKGPRFVKIGRHLACRREDLDRWLEQQFSQTA